MNLLETFQTDIMRVNRFFLVCFCAIITLSGFTQNVKKHLITQGSWHGEIDNKLDNGKTYITDLNIDIIKDENNNISHFVSVFSDVTERKKNENAGCRSYSGAQWEQNTKRRY